MSKQKHHLRPKYVALRAAQEKAQAKKDASKMAVASKDEAGDGLWTALNEQYLDAIATATQAVSVSPLLRNVALIDTMTTEQQASLTAASSQLAQDTSSLMKNLRLIHDAHKENHGDTKDEAEIHRALVIGDQYVKWMEDWENRILPSLETITNLFADVAGVQVKLNPAADEPGQDAVLIESDPAIPTPSTTNVTPEVTAS